MLRTKDDKKVFVASAISLGLLLVATALPSWIRASKHFESDSAYHLAEASYEDEKIHLKEEAQRLGGFPSKRALAAQWQLLHSEMLEHGVTTKIADDILARAASSKITTIGGTFLNFHEQLWPLAVNAGSINGKEVWVVHLAYWNTKAPPHTGWCGTTNFEFRQLAHKTYVIDAKPPHRCWINSLYFKYMNPQEQKEYISDE